MSHTDRISPSFKLAAVASPARCKRTGFLQAVKHTAAPKGASEVASDCPTDRSLELSELRSVDVTAARKMAQLHVGMPTAACLTVSDYFTNSTSPGRHV